jgi:hypothetical protein
MATITPGELRLAWTPPWPEWSDRRERNVPRAMVKEIRDAPDDRSLASQPRRRLEVELSSGEVLVVQRRAIAAVTQWVIDRIDEALSFDFSTREAPPSKANAISEGFEPAADAPGCFQRQRDGRIELRCFEKSRWCLLTADADGLWLRQSYWPRPREMRVRPEEIFDVRGEAHEEHLPSPTQRQRLENPLPRLLNLYLISGSVTRLFEQPVGTTGLESIACDLRNCLQILSAAARSRRYLHAPVVDDALPVVPLDPTIETAMASERTTPPLPYSTPSNAVSIMQGAGRLLVARPRQSSSRTWVTTLLATAPQYAALIGILSWFAWILGHSTMFPFVACGIVTGAWMIVAYARSDQREERIIVEGGELLAEVVTRYRGPERERYPCNEIERVAVSGRELWLYLRDGRMRRLTFTASKRDIERVAEALRPALGLLPPTEAKHAAVA